MMTRIAEPISVTLGGSGAPIELSWGETLYRVVSRPILWVKRERWWEHRQSLQEIPVWQFNAVSVAAECVADQVASAAQTSQAGRTADPALTQPAQATERLVRMEVVRLPNPQRWQLVAYRWVELDQPTGPTKSAGPVKPAAPAET